MLIVGWILLVVGFIALIVGELMVFRFAYRLGAAWLVACIVFEPIAWVALLVLDYREARKPIGIAFTGLLIAGIGGLIAGWD